MSIIAGANIVDNGLVLCIDPANLKSYSGSGSLLYNTLNASQTTSLINGPSFTSSGKGEIVLDGINDYIQVNSSVTSQDLSPAVATFDIWLKPDNTGYGANNRSSPISRGNYNTSGGFFIHLRYYSSPAIQATFSNSSVNSYSFQGPESTINLNWNEWVNVVITVNSTISIYSNGILRGTGNRSVSNIIYGNGTINTNGDTNLMLCSGLGYVPTIDQGIGGTWRPYKGSMSVFKLYNRVLTATEVKQNFESTRSRYGI